AIPRWKRPCMIAGPHESRPLMLTFIVPGTDWTLLPFSVPEHSPPLSAPSMTPLTRANVRGVGENQTDPSRLRQVPEQVPPAGGELAHRKRAGRRLADCRARGARTRRGSPQPPLDPSVASGVDDRVYVVGSDAGALGLKSTRAKEPTAGTGRACLVRPHHSPV